MDSTLKKHPAVRLGTWLKKHRRAKGIVKYRFALLIDLTASEYTEVEAGISRWIQSQQEKLIAMTLDLSEVAARQFDKLLAAARKAVSLSFAQLFTRDQLEPMRLRAGKSCTPDATLKAMILNAVFTPIS